MRLAADAADFNVIVFTETWADDSLPNSMLFSSDKFIVYRCDRNINNSSRTRGGSVLIAVSTSLASAPISVNAAPLKCVWVVIKNECFNIYI